VAEQQIEVGRETENLYKEGSASDGLTNKTGQLLIIGIGIGIPSLSIGSKFFGASFVYSKLCYFYHELE
jgi:hypothetical protein